MSREIMQQALTALRISTPFAYALEYYEFRNKAIKALEAELAKPEQELPMLRQVVIESALKGYGKPEQEPKLSDAGADTNIDPFTLYPKGSGMVMLNQVGMRVDLKDAPPRKPWQGLTGTEINHIFAANVGYPERMCRAIEAKLKEKNT
jgi:hypothetical protein